MEENNYTVYMHENKINSKKYIGITGKKPEERWRKGTNYRTCTAINRAFEKYGWDGFNHVIIKTGLTREEACDEEKRLIKEYNTRNPEYGYNICVGGSGTEGCTISEDERQRRSDFWKGENNPNYKGKMWTPEYREYQRRINTGKKLTEEHKKKISEGCKGKIHHDDEFKRRLSERTSKPVVRDDGLVFSSVTKAAESIGVNSTAITNAIKRGQRSGKHYWKYAELNA